MVFELRLNGTRCVQERQLVNIADADANAVVTGVVAGRKRLGSQPEMDEK